MSTETELKKWLRRSEKSFVENLQFGIKAWNSIELNLITKYEIIIEYFNENIVSQYKNCGKDDCKIVSEFLELNYPPSSVPSVVKQSTVEQLMAVLTKSAGKKPKKYILDWALMILYQNSMWGFYKNNFELTCDYIGCVLNYYTQLLRTQTLDHNCEDNTVKSLKMLEHLKTYLKLLSKSDNFQGIVFKKVYVPLVKFETLLSSSSIQLDEIFLNIFQIIIGEIKSNTPLVAMFKNQKFSRAVTLSTIKNLLRSKSLLDDNSCRNFIKYIFEDLFNNDESIQENLNNIQLVLFFIKQYQCEYNAESLEKSISEIFEKYHTVHPYEVLAIVCSAIKLNPIILSKHLIEFTITYMFKRKSSCLSEKFNEFLYLVIDMYNKLYQTKVFIVKLNESVVNYLKNNALSKKLKRKLDDNNGGDVTLMDIDNAVENDEDNFYTKILIAEQTQSEKFTTLMNKNYEWPEIEYAWPVSVISAKIITSFAALVSNLSLSTWQFLLFQLNEIVTNIDVNKINENLLFEIDFQTSFLCQYYAGSRLVESYPSVRVKFDTVQNEMRLFLTRFGHKIISINDSTTSSSAIARLMNNFLRICYHVGNFELLLMYYAPDSIQANDPSFDVRTSSQNLHSYLTDDEWGAIEAKIVTTIKSTDCKTNLNSIRLQKTRAYGLFTPIRKKLKVGANLVSSTFDDYETVSQILRDDSTNLWFLENLSHDEKMVLIETLQNQDVATEDHQMLVKILLRNEECAHLYTIQLYKNISENCFTSEHAVMKTIDFSKLKTLDINAIKYLTDFLTKDNNLDELLNSDSRSRRNIKKSGIVQLKQNYDTLKSIKVMNFPREIKTILFNLNIVVLLDAHASGYSDVIETCVNFFHDILEYRETPNAIKLLGIETLLKIFMNFENSQKLFTHLFREIIKIDKLNEIEGFMKKLLQIFKSSPSEYTLELLMMSCEFLNSLKPVNKKSETLKIDAIRKELSITILDHLVEKFGKTLNDNHKRLIGKTLDGFYFTLKLYFEHGAAGEDDKKTLIAKFPEKYSTLIKMYVHNSIELENRHSINLLRQAYELKECSFFNRSDYDKILDQYWSLFKENVTKNVHFTKVIDLEKNFRFERNRSTFIDFLNILFRNRDEKKFVLLLGEIVEMLRTEENHCRTMNLVSILAGCTYDQEKNSIFSEFFYRTTNEIILKTSSHDLLQTNMDVALCLLTAFNMYVTNTSNNKSYSHIDNILSFMFHLKITHFKVSPTNRDQYLAILWNMIELCINLIRHANLYIVQRLPQFFGIIKNVLETICWYGLNVTETYTLDAIELSFLSKLAHKLEKLIFNLTKSNSADVKRLVPHLLCFIIHIMISKTNTTTISHQQIRTHFTNICHSLIANGNEKSKGFILRVSSDAGRRVYEDLVKEYEKYRQFKGSS